jgi:hypothetical protein
LKYQECRQTLAPVAVCLRSSASIRLAQAAGAVKHASCGPSLEKLIDPLTRGDPESPLRWTCKSLAVISVDTTKKNWWGISATVARSGSRRASPNWSMCTTFRTRPVGKAIPYGIHDIAANHGFVSVGVDHDTPVFAATTILGASMQ